MIRLVQGANAADFPDEIDSMFRARAAVFHDRLGWEVQVVDGREIDEFDHENPLYLLSIDEHTRTVAGSMRLMPTTGPNMLRDRFGPFFDEPIDIESPLIWECTRYCLHPSSFGREVSNTGAMRTTWELAIGLCEVTLHAGIAQIQGVYDAAMARTYRRTRWTPVPIAKSSRLGSDVVFVGLWDVSEQVLHRMRQASGIAASILESAPERMSA